MTTTRLSRTLAALVALGAVLAVAPLADPAGAATTVGPGDQLYADGAQCTANFVFTSGGTTYIGEAAHCFGTGAATDTNGCDAGTLPLGTTVTDADDAVVGTLAYSSWITMQGRNETDEETCEYNDLALVALAPGVVADPTAPHWGGPVGLAAPGAPQAGATVYSYGNSSLRLGLTQLSPKTGTGISDSPGGWSHSVYTVSPGIPGDSGSGFLDAEGRAFGVLSTLAIAPLAGSNGVLDLPKALAYANAHGGIGTVSLSTGGTFAGGLPV
jgi:hypothetical protein